MAKAPFVMQKIFSNLLPSTIGVIGSIADGSPTTSDDLDTIQSGSRFDQGLSRLLVNGASPFMQDFNGLFYLLTSQIRRLQRTGIGEWLPSVIYSEGDVATLNGDLYISLADNNTDSPDDIYYGAAWRLISPKTIFAMRATAGWSKVVTQAAPSFTPQDIGMGAGPYVTQRGTLRFTASVPLLFAAGAPAGMYVLTLKGEAPGAPAPVFTNDQFFYKPAGVSKHNAQFISAINVANPYNLSLTFTMTEYPGAFSLTAGVIDSGYPYLEIARVK